MSNLGTLCRTGLVCIALFAVGGAMVLWHQPGSAPAIAYLSLDAPNAAPVPGCIEPAPLPMAGPPPELEAAPAEPEAKPAPERKPAHRAKPGSKAAPKKPVPTAEPAPKPAETPPPAASASPKPDHLQHIEHELQATQADLESIKQRLEEH